MDQGSVKNCLQILQKHHFEPIKKLGKGAFGLVYLTSKNNHYYSVKCTNKKLFLKKPQLKKYIKQQIQVMKSLKHPNIVRLYDSFEDGNWIFMVTEYCNIGNLTQILTEKQHGVFSFDQCRSIIQEVISGLTHMHSKDILHRDIKLQNILRTQEKQNLATKICDLGFSREFQDEANTFCGTSSYMAPQILSKKPYNTKVDIWALGVVLFSMLFGHLPFKALNMELQIRSKCEYGFEISKCKIKNNPSINKHILKMLSEVFKGVFQVDCEKRWTLQMVSAHFFKRDVKELKYRTSSSTQTTDTEREETLFQIEEVQFIQWVLKDVQKLKFLNFAEFLTLKYYLDKVCLSILVFERDVANFTKKQMEYIERFRQSQKLDYHLISQETNNQKAIKLKEKKNKVSVIFKEYKEEYRMAVGHAFSKAHQSIKNIQLKTRTKLKILCCHLINRVFEREHRKVIFQYYFRWRSSKSDESFFDLTHLRNWIEEEEEDKIAKTIELINNRFYRKGKAQ